MKDIHIDVKRCADCGCDRGGTIDLTDKNPVLRCWDCTARRNATNGRRRERAN